MTTKRILRPLCWLSFCKSVIFQSCSIILSIEGPARQTQKFSNWPTEISIVAIFLATLLVILRDQRAVRFSSNLLQELTFMGPTNGASFSQFPRRFLSMHIYLRISFCYVDIDSGVLKSDRIRQVYGGGHEGPFLRTRMVVGRASYF
jgi:hypothetical protein